MRFCRGDLTLACDAQLAAQLAARHGQDVTIGIRAEDIDADGVNGAAGDCSLTGEIGSVLPVGSDQFLGLHCAGEQMFFRVGKERSYRVGERLTLPVNRGRLHLFDRQSGRLLSSGRSDG